MPRHCHKGPLPQSDRLRPAVCVIQAVLYPPIQLIVGQRSQTPASVANPRHRKAFINDPLE